MIAPALRPARPPETSGDHRPLQLMAPAQEPVLVVSRSVAANTDIHLTRYSRDADRRYMTAFSPLAWRECRDQLIGHFSHGHGGGEVELVDGDKHRHTARRREGDITKGAL